MNSDINIEIKSMTEEEVIEKFEGFIISLINKCSNSSSNIFEDIYQSAVIELLKRHAMFDPNNGAHFTVYCKPYILEVIKQEVCFQQVPIKMYYQTAHKHIQKDNLHILDDTILDQKENGSDALEKYMELDDMQYKIQKLKDKVSSADLSKNERASLVHIINRIENNTYERARINQNTLELFHRILNGEKNDR